MGEQLDTFFDACVALTEETIDIFADTDKQRQIARAQHIDALRELLLVEPDALYRSREPPPGLLYLRKQLRQVKPYVLAQPVVQLALDMVARSGDVPVPYQPFLKLPFWIEFDRVEIGEEDATRFVALLAMRDFRQDDAIRVQFFTPDLQRTKELFFQAGTGLWEYEQIGTCESERCQLARYTVAGQPYRLTREQSLEWMHKACTCARAGFTWAQLVNVLNHLLHHRKQPLMEQIEQREMALPSSPPKTRREKVANAELRKKSRPNVVTISLSAPVQVQPSRVKTPDEPSTIQFDFDFDEKISVEGYYKVLIPGETKPWRSLQIIPIASYARRGKVALPRTRVRVEE